MEVIRRDDFRLPVKVVQIVPVKCWIGNRPAEDVVDDNSSAVQLGTYDIPQGVDFLVRSKIRYSRRYPIIAQIDAPADFAVLVQIPKDFPPLLHIVLADDNAVRLFQNLVLFAPELFMENQGIP